jgi:hypothetical protein
MSAPTSQKMIQCPYGCGELFLEVHAKCKGVTLPVEKIIDLPIGRRGGLSPDIVYTGRVKDLSKMTECQLCKGWFLNKHEKCRGVEGGVLAPSQVFNKFGGKKGCTKVDQTLVYWEKEEPEEWWKHLLTLNNAIVLHTHEKWERDLEKRLRAEGVKIVVKKDNTGKKVLTFDVTDHCKIVNVAHLYGIKDVLAFERCEKMLFQLTGSTLRTKQTIAQMGYDWWKKTCPVKWEALKGELYSFAKRAAWGARSACTAGNWESKRASEIEAKELKYEDLLGDPTADVRYQLDSNSMYPAMMHGMEGMPTTYPVGASHMLKDPAEAQTAFRSGKAGLYEVRYTRPAGLQIGILPTRGPDDSLIWDKKPGVATGVFTAVDLETAEEYKYELEFLGPAVIWESKTDNFFRDYVSKLYEIKSTTTDPIIKQMIKWMLNRLYGKLGQQVRGKLQEPQAISEEKAMERMLAGELIDNCDASFYLPQEKPRTSDNIYPNHLASYVLAWGRRYMLRMMAVVDYRFDFSHTDCLRVSSADYVKLRDAGYVSETDLGLCKIDHGGLIYRSQQVSKIKYVLWVLTKENKLKPVLKGEWKEEERMKLKEQGKGEWEDEEEKDE